MGAAPVPPAEVVAPAKAGGGPRWRRPRGSLPGFGLSLVFTVAYLSLIVLIPVAGLFWRTASLSAADMARAVLSPRALAAYKLSFGASMVAAAVNVVFGVLVAWVLARYEFPGRRIVDAMVDLPFALPTAVAGIALTTLYAESGWLGRYLEPHGIKVAF